MKITIESTINGAVLDIEGQKECFKFEKDDLEGLLEMFYVISEQLVSTNKYDKERLRIELDHGNGYECKDDDCKICQN